MFNSSTHAQYHRGHAFVKALAIMRALSHTFYLSYGMPGNIGNPKIDQDRLNERPANLLTYLTNTYCEGNTRKNETIGDPHSFWFKPWRGWWIFWGQDDDAWLGAWCPGLQIDIQWCLRSGWWSCPSPLDLELVYACNVLEASRVIDKHSDMRRRWLDHYLDCCSSYCRLNASRLYVIETLADPVKYRRRFFAISM